MSFSELVGNLRAHDLFLCEHFKPRFFEAFSMFRPALPGLDVTQVTAEKNMIQETGKSNVKTFFVKIIRKVLIAI